MLQSTFHRLVRGVSAEKESKLWRQGILSWDDLERYRLPQEGLFREEIAQHSSPFSVLRDALRSEDASYFYRTLDRREHYRIALAFPRRTLFLDIETTGLSRYYDYVTLIGWCYQDQYRVLVRGDDVSALRAALRDALVVVTFNGSLFDLPFLRQEFPDLPIPSVHLDLRFLAKRVDRSGGQKAIEEELGFKRPISVQTMNGEAAPLLWHKYRRGDIGALRRLIEYNHCDVEGMKFIFDHVVDQLVKARRVPRPIRQQIPSFALPTSVVWANGHDYARDSCLGIKLTPFKGVQGPAVTLTKLSQTSRSQVLRVVGIDLTGSEIRPSGWCLLDGNVAVTRMLAADKEIIEATIAARPQLVSIDSPLSLPRGRVSVSDDDPGRDKFGIMRKCERILKKRGVNVYPALIGSMQKLTARGIRLASHLRSLGLPVIESYPGAAQDIIGIPRKRASLEMLAEGLAEFGVLGEYRIEKTTHDELDAITAAIVGLFFWSGRFEALGSEEEEALIIPDLKKDPRPWRERRVIGISGPIAAGKTSAARYLESEGYSYARYSSVLEEILKAEGRTIDRRALQEFGNYVHREHGQRWLCRQLLRTLPSVGPVVIDGLRFPDDHSFLVEAFGPGFLHLHLDAPETVRHQRFESRHNFSVDFATAQAHPVEAQAGSLRQLAHDVMPNEASIEVLHGDLLALAQSRRS
jgi:uncharacterized protein YprB with RNaseH-like and TPR domain/predicted nuclease with RNAse H fold/dephospho-CoA kinase